MNIQLRSRRGPIGKGWHAVALRNAMETILGVGRASGGRADARSGRVAWIDVTTGTARGAVQDSDGELYRPQLDLPAFSAADTEAFLVVARAHPGLPATMAAGEYPQLVEKELSAHEVSLLPRGPSELSHDCSCLDWPGPCRHVAALAYVLVEAVDEKPLLLLTLRGLRIEDLVAPVSTGPVPADDASAPEPDGPGSGGAAAPDGSGDAAASGGSGDAAAPDGSDAGSARRSPGFDPRRADPALVAEVMGEHVAAVIAAFYRDGSPGNVDNHPDGRA
ncbi:SWIM zinc finger family protein [Brachybacterium sp. p3-SID1565]|uniref:SWIM zinc finger family protein n=1 Tax=Brachybacterium sp. p3-SID1565 TaxID=2916046 RepID=UPI0021A41A10|nr:SWIM zinc finger family protein [Brachybacterium sp. p3-SID1565]MCT1385461.1 SWIM zinc finger family protein [Brachybacterium sp. p3-SID1565]